MTGKVLFSGVAAAFILGSVPQAGLALPVAPIKQAPFGGVGQITHVAAQQEKAKKKTTTKRTTTTTTTKRTTTQTNRNVRVNRNVHVDRNVRVRRTVIVRRPYRAWAYRPYYGTVIAGVALGTVIGVGAAYAVPVAPAPNLCWYWADSAGWRGYWDYCVVP